MCAAMDQTDLRITPLPLPLELEFWTPIAEAPAYDVSTWGRVRRGDLLIDSLRRCAAMTVPPLRCDCFLPALLSQREHQRGVLPRQDEVAASIGGS
jgi:hypothetical protein